MTGNCSKSTVLRTEAEEWGRKFRIARAYYQPAMDVDTENLQSLGILLWGFPSTTFPLPQLSLSLSCVSLPFFLVSSSRIESFNRNDNGNLTDDVSLGCDVSDKYPSVVFDKIVHWICSPYHLHVMVPRNVFQPRIDHSSHLDMV